MTLIRNEGSGIEQPKEPLVLMNIMKDKSNKYLPNFRNFWYFGGCWLVLGLVVLFLLQGGFEGEEQRGEERRGGG